MGGGVFKLMELLEQWGVAAASTTQDAVSLVAPSGHEGFATIVQQKLGIPVREYLSQLAGQVTRPDPC